MRSPQDRRIKLYRKRWYVVWNEAGQTKRAPLHTKDRAQAERAFQEHLRQLGQGSKTISEIKELWFADKQGLSSIKDAERKARPILAFFGNLLPDHITRELCRKYKKDRGVSNTTVRNELALLRSWVNWHDPNNKAVFDFPPTDPPKDHYLTSEEYIELLNACKAWHLKLFIITALHTGARSNAVLDLTWDRVDLQRGLINLSKGPQTNKRRALVPINPILKRYLLSAYRARTSDYVIDFGGKKITSIRKGFGDTAFRAGVEASPHILRHTAAMVMAESGVPFEEIEQFLGHSGRSTTQRVYAKFSPTYLQKAASSLAYWHRRAVIEQPRFRRVK